MKQESHSSIAFAAGVRVNPRAAAALLALAAMCSTACASRNDASYIDAGDPDAAPPLRNDPCSGDGFRGSTAGAVACPGANACSCAAPEVCCMLQIDSKQGTCQSFESCRSIALTCGGPDGCPGADGGPGVCCLDQGPGGGTFCRAGYSDCPSHKILCHVDDDCRGAPGAPYCRPADFGTQGVSDRGLDGLIGICSST